MTDKEKEGLKWLSELYAAATQGKTIQVIRSGKWTDCVSFDEFPDFDSFNYGFMDDYRIKPEPRKFWVVKGPMTLSITASQVEALEAQMTRGPSYEVIEVIESL